MIDVTLVPVFQDNYAFIIVCKDSGSVGILDPGEAAPIIRVLDSKGLTPDYIFVTHHHWDHVDGLELLKAHYPKCKVVAPDREKNKIAFAEIPLKNNAVLKFGKERVHAIETPGHTLGSMCYYFETSRSVFTGDTLFSLGCGRIFEGTSPQMFKSFQKLKALPSKTLVYPGHEYTRANAGFCLRIEPNNKDLKAYIKKVKALREKKLPTLPSTIEIEEKTNVFMRAKNAKAFALLRQKKNIF